MSNQSETPIPANDGIDHINVYSRGATRLGRFLTNLSGYPLYVIEYDRTFRSVEHLWFWLQTRDDRILDVASTFNIKPFIKSNKIQMNHVPDFKKIIIKAFVKKLKNIHHTDKEIFNMFCSSTLPFKHYYFYGEKDNAKVILQPKHEWMMEAWERIRHEINKPDSTFSKLLLISNEFGE